MGSISGEPIRQPQRPALADHEVIVLLEGVHLTFEDIDTAPLKTHEMITYHRVTAPAEVRERIQCASIVIATQCRINAESLGEAPHLVDEENKNSWKREGSIAYKMQTANGQPPLSIEQEVVGIIGYGSIGKRLATFCRALGMQVLISERKGAIETRKTDSSSSDGGTAPVISRTPFDQVIQTATVLVLCCTFTESSRHLIDAAELSVMRPEAILINVSRGGILNNAAVVGALRDRRISGLAVDVFDSEPASSAEDSALLAAEARDLNIILSPHVGYFSTKTVLTMKAMVRDHIKSFVEGDYSKFEA
ncbi:hypothetical protein E8E14_012724 [Neopestalotiopsis sp. 37M]|nr:hypothetical protein E8E14_012724 [Neopestalotiopsis sp. 37M]